jgi:hypothetical protein
MQAARLPGEALEPDAAELTPDVRLTPLEEAKRRVWSGSSTARKCRVLVRLLV